MKFTRQSRYSVVPEQTFGAYVYTLTDYVRKFNVVMYTHNEY